MDYEQVDKDALHAALLALNTCPRCRRPLRPAWSDKSMLACVGCDKTWPAPKVEQPCPALGDDGQRCGDTDTQMTDCCNTFRCYEHRLRDDEGNVLCNTARCDGGAA